MIHRRPPTQSLEDQVVDWIKKRPAIVAVETEILKSWCNALEYEPNVDSFGTYFGGAMYSLPPPLEFIFVFLDLLQPVFIQVFSFCRKLSEIEQSGIPKQNRLAATRTLCIEPLCFKCLNCCCHFSFKGHSWLLPRLTLNS